MVLYGLLLMEEQTVLILISFIYYIALKLCRELEMFILQMLTCDNKNACSDQTACGTRRVWSVPVLFVPPIAVFSR